MKAYLITSGVIFGLIAVLHLIRAIQKWPLHETDPWYFIFLTELGVLSAVLSTWACRLLRRQPHNTSNNR